MPTEGLDDLIGLAWLTDGRRLLLLDATSLAIVDVESGRLLRIPAITGIGFAWFEA